MIRVNPFDTVVEVAADVPIVTVAQHKFGSQMGGDTRECLLYDGQERVHYGRGSLIFRGD